MMEKLSSKGLLRSLLVKGGRCAAEGDGISIFNGFFTSTDTLLPAFFLHGTLKLGEVPERMETELDSFSLSLKMVSVGQRFQNVEFYL